MGNDAKRAGVSPLSIEELAVARPTSVMGKLIGVAAIALIGGGLFAAMSTRLSGSLSRPAQPATTLAAPTTPAPLPAVKPSAAAPQQQTASAANVVRPTPQAIVTASRALAAAGAHAANEPAAAPAPVTPVAPIAPVSHAPPPGKSDGLHESKKSGSASRKGKTIESKATLAALSKHSKPSKHASAHPRTPHAHAKKSHPASHPHH